MLSFGRRNYLWSRSISVFQSTRKRTNRKYTSHVPNDSLIRLYYGNSSSLRNHSFTTSSNYYRDNPSNRAILPRLQTLHLQQKSCVFLSYKCRIIRKFFRLLQKRRTSRKQSLSIIFLGTYRGFIDRITIF